MLFDEGRPRARRHGAGPGRRRRRRDRAIPLARAAGLRVWVDQPRRGKRERALELGADAAFEPGARLPERVDAVIETVGEATWAHSLKSLQARRHARRLAARPAARTRRPT